jgi:hypothetical protein
VFYALRGDDSKNLKYGGQFANSIVSAIPLLSYKRSSGSRPNFPDSRTTAGGMIAQILSPV